MAPRRILLLTALLLALAPAARAQEAAAQKLNEQLYEAVRRGDAAEVKALLDRGADVNAKFRYGATALFKAAERGHVEVVKLLLERGADATVKDTFYGATAMTWALDGKHVEVVRALLAKDADSVSDVLMAGVREGRVEFVRMALDRGGLKPESLTSALVAATEDGGRAEIADLLRKAGAQPPPEVSAATLESYAGKYRGDPGPEVAITLKDGKLYATPAGQRAFVLMAVDQTTFRPAAFDGVSVTFNVEGGKVTGLALKQGPNTTQLKRVEENKQ
ncbi:MAG TPA: ankyrin repeat domain-containing protein [Pyrinomonadaceae bacterium]|nr:ankyrin repeat domain-containing protein [Pyrinomonadaceae bacterium]